MNDVREGGEEQVPEPAPSSSDKPPPAHERDPLLGQTPGPPRGAAWLPEVTTTLAAIVLALVVGAVVIALSDEDTIGSMGYFFSYPWDVFRNGGDVIWSSYSALARGAVGSQDAVATTLVRAAPLMCAALGVTLAFRAGLFNIGAQGQLALGSLAAIFVAIKVDAPAIIHVPLVLLAGMAGGAFWGFIPGFLKARTGAHEVITTIMLNNIATRAVVIFVLGLTAFQRPGQDQLLTPAPADSARFWSVGGVHFGVVVALLAALAVWWLIERSKIGFEMRAVGANADAARTAGMSVAKVFTVAMLLAGALAGLAATMNILGKGEPVTDTAFGAIGFDAITVALLGRATPLGTVLAALLFGALSNGGRAMEVNAGTSSELAAIVQALIVLFVAAPTLVRGLIRLRSAGGGSTILAKGWAS